MIDRISLLLEAFNGPGQLTLAQVVRRTGLPRSSAHRLLERLVQLRFLNRRGRDYELGMRLVELGHLAVHQDRVHRAAVPYLWDLHRATGLVVHLAILDGPDVVYLDKLGGHSAAALPSRVGGRYPAHCTAVGKVLLAHSGEVELPDFDTAASARKTRNSVASRAQLCAELAKSRAYGYAFDREEAVPRFGCVAAPVGEAGDVVAAVSVCGPVEKITFDQSLVGPVRITALRIWQNLDDGPARVQPTLQRMRPLRGGPVQASEPSALQYV